MNDYDIKEKISGTIENVVYRNDSNDYTVLEISDNDNNLITAVGIIPMAFEGERVELTGNWSFHKEFGKQFSFTSFEKFLPEEEEGILQYLSSRTVKGVGPVTAVKIVNRFGIDTFDVMENHSEWLADIPGITLKKAAAISESFREQTGLRGVMMFCKDHMAVGEATKVYKKFGGGAVGIIQENPYILCNGEFGISFEKADALAKSLGVAPDSRNRIYSGMLYTLSYNAQTNGHTCLPKEKLISAAAVLLEIEEASVASTLELILSDRELSTYKVGDITYVMTNETAEDEEVIASRFATFSDEMVHFSMSDVSSMIEKVERSLNITFAPLQREALFAAVESGVMILTGGPGTGKTTVIRAMISIFDILGIKTVLAAPTGRAAKRMSEATSEEAKTVHRLLEVDRLGVDNSLRFQRNAKYPLSEDAVIVDEASMLDLSLIAALVRALKRGSRLILIGDSDQLPSVGAGNVLADLIATERIRTIRLTEIFRQSEQSLIVTNAHRINDGKAPLLTVTDNDFFFVRRENEWDIAETIAELVTKRLPRTYGVGIKDRLQVITPSKKGAGGVESLNAALQSHINPPGKFKREKSRHGVIFREGDKVMQTANNYEIEWKKNGVVGIGLFNGDIGIIEQISPSEDRVIIRFDDRVAEYDSEMLDELELAYAITVHKSQGSEYPVVIIPMYYCPPMLMTRNLLYTAVTRARRMVILVGRSDIPTKMVENKREVMRYTTLKNKICDYY